MNQLLQTSDLFNQSDSSVSSYVQDGGETNFTPGNYSFLCGLRYENLPHTYRLTTPEILFQKYWGSVRYVIPAVNFLPLL